MMMMMMMMMMLLMMMMMMIMLMSMMIMMMMMSRYDTIPLEYAGYCPVALLSGAGLLLPGNARQGKYFARNVDKNGM